MKHSKLATFSLFAIAALALSATASVGLSASQSSVRVSVKEAVECTALSREIAGAKRVNSAWAGALRSWGSTIGSEPERKRYNRMVRSQNRAANITDTGVKRYNRQCVNARMSRTVYDQVCRGIDSDFCRGFDF